ncbi:hypothetical protein [Roseibium aggregatum]|uniref:Uncharacterized protein n=1 Tax=Roseibium aggregatum TaxID=187304 RepID=A0A926P4F7_9HYPH|nr:hypothetical protein [Roseibium aggregatum]MBD1549223.1 hypothetical protein [Roseibium aggregatum]
MREFFRSTACRLVLVLCASAPFAPLPAMAFTPTGNDVADAFMAVLETDDGMVDSYGSVSEGGETVVIKDLLLKRKDDDKKSATIATTTLRDGMVQSNGRLKLGTLSMSDLSVTAEDGGLAIGSFTATNLVLPTPEELNGSDGKSVIGPSYETLEVLDAAISDGSGNKFGIGRLFTAIDEMDGDLPTAFRFAIDDLKIKAANLDDEAQKSLTDLGYETLTISAEGQGRWDPEKETLEVKNLKLSGADAGTFALNLSLGGVTREVITKLGAAEGDPESAMGLVQGVSVQNVSVRLDNSSLVERVLDMQAREAGMDRTTLVQQLTAGLPMMVSILQNPAFQEKVVTAATTFLNDPVSLEVTVAPANPVPFAQIMGQAMMAPQTLPEVLGVDVVANSAN